MPEDQTGVIEPDVAGQEPVIPTDLNTAEAAPELTVDDPTLSEREKGLLQGQIAERKKRQDVEAQMAAQTEAVQRQMLINQAQYQQPQYQQPQQPQADPFAAYLNARGYDPDGVLTASEQAQLMAEFVQMNNQNVQRQAFVTQTPDFSSIVGTQLPNGQFIKPDGTPSAFQMALNKKPYLATANLDNPTAYALGMAEMELSQAQPASNQAAHMAAQAATAPMAGVSAGGGAVLPQDAGVEQMAPGSAEFATYLAKVRDGELD